MKRSSRIIDLTGKQFGRLSVISLSPKRNRTEAVWVCVCDCGKTISTTGSCLRSGGSRSCGCLHSNVTRNRNRTHGCSGSDEYNAWLHMRRRCSDPKDIRFEHYGGRGILVCQRWSEFGNFLKDMGLKPSRKHSIERLDRNGNYEPSNCVWATPKTQANNTRSNRRVTIGGTTKNLTQWAVDSGISVGTLWYRLSSGWEPAEAISKPVRRYV